jgi:citrate synthase
MTDWIGAAEAAERLGIKPASLYAYVSRGILARQRDPEGRGSLFDAAEIERLARKGRPRRAPAGTDLVIESALTQITPEHFRYRGRDVTALAVDCTFEEVARLLWTPPDPAGPGAGHRGPDDRRAGEQSPRTPAGGPGAAGWQATPAALAAGWGAQAALPTGLLPLERLQVIVPALATTDPLRLHLDRPAVIAAGQALIAGMVDCLPPAAGGGRAGRNWPVPPPPASAVPDSAGPGSAAPGSAAPASAGLAPAAPGSVAARLTAALCQGPPPAGLSGIVQATMILLADHDLAPSTLAARVAASVRADPYAVVTAGLAAVGGAFHGGATLAAEAMLRSAARPDDAPRVISDLLRRGERIPGFGHFAYPAGDPRAALLLRLLEQYAPASPRLAAAGALIAEARRRALPEPNIDFATGALNSVAGLAAGSGEAIFAIARVAGWIAHALEEYERRTPIRPRSVYTGPPGPDGP